MTVNNVYVFLQDSEIEMLTDISHLQEIIDQLCMHTGDPNILPPASEQVILDATGADRLAWSFQVRRSMMDNLML